MCVSLSIYMYVCVHIYIYIYIYIVWCVHEGLWQFVEVDSGVQLLHLRLLRRLSTHCSEACDAFLLFYVIVVVTRTKQHVMYTLVIMHLWLRFLVYIGMVIYIVIVFSVLFLFRSLRRLS